MNTTHARRCPACREAMLQPVTRERTFHPHGKDVRVKLLTSRCPACGAEATSAAQHDENLARLAARKAQYGGLLLGEEVLALRRRYGITQQAAGKLFGKGKIAFSRYERETSYPDPGTTLLLTLALEKPGVVRWLADQAGIDLPLWVARCADERDAKVRSIPTTVKKTSLKANGWLITSRTEQQSRTSAGYRSERHAGQIIYAPTRATAIDEKHHVARVQYA